MADTQELAAAITAAIQAPRTPGPRDPKYESLEVMPETGSPDLLERSATVYCLIEIIFEKMFFTATQPGRVHLQVTQT